jgi:regulator of protease activity HflC (stomatin/prohibitin superfamily)
MAEIRNLGPVRHLRADAASHVLHYRGATLRRSGRGLAFWFAPWAASVAEVPVDDREIALAFHGRSADFQDVVVLGALTYRIVEPARTADRVDFTIDLRKGGWLKQPIEKIAASLSQLAQQHTQGYLQGTPLRDILTQGHERIRRSIEETLDQAPLLLDMGLALVSVRISSLKPSNDLERALEAPTRERLQQEADEATFRRRALAVEKERAIQENELQNQIELARREEQLIAQRGQNARRESTEKAEAERIETESRAASRRVQGEAEADSIRAIDGARLTLEQERLDAYRTMPPALVAALAGKELAGKLQKIEHLNVTPDLLGTMLTRLVQAGGGAPKADGAR